MVKNFQLETLLVIEQAQKKQDLAMNSTAIVRRSSPNNLLTFEKDFLFISDRLYRRDGCNDGRRN